MELNFANRTLFHSDNLPILRGMNSETVDLIATDPPFNKGRDFHATPDSLARGARFQDRWSWADDTEGEWVDAIKDDFPAVWSVIEYARASYGDDMGAFLCFMGVRLMEMHRVLKPTGSLYLHCDSTASHYLKAMCDAVFGRRNFRNEIVWRRAHGGKTSQYQPRGYGNNHDVLLFYAKTDVVRCNPFRELTDSEKDDMFPLTDKSGRVAIEDGSIKRLVYEEDHKGAPLGNVWTDIPFLTGSNPERVGYPTQKPLALYERIIQASSNPGDMILDPFCGCATTPIAAERLGRQWVGIDIWEGAHQMILRRLRSEGLATPEGVHYDDERPHLLTEGDVRLATRPPERTDEGESAPELRLTLRRQRAVERWQKLSHDEIRAELEDAQSWRNPELVICAGCGRGLEAPFMELDHVNPRAQGGENWITNRILLCRPCNGRKRHELTLIGLNNENKRDGWMKDASAADESRQRALIRGGLVRDNDGGLAD